MIENEGNQVEEQNMVPEEALKRRLAEQTRKHEKMMREREEAIRREYEDRSLPNPEQQISNIAAQNVVSNAQPNFQGGYIREEDLPEILSRADEYRRQKEEELRKQKEMEEENRINMENLSGARQSIIDEVNNNNDLKEKIKNHGDNDTLNKLELAIYELGIPSKLAPELVKNLFNSEENLAKFKSPNTRSLDRKQLMMNILMQNEANKLSNSLPTMGGQFAIKSGSSVRREPRTTAELRKQAREDGLY